MAFGALVGERGGLHDHLRPARADVGLSEAGDDRRAVEALAVGLEVYPFDAVVQGHVQDGVVQPLLPALLLHVVLIPRLRDVALVQGAHLAVLGQAAFVEGILVHIAEEGCRAHHTGVREQVAVDRLAKVFLERFHIAVRHHAGIALTLYSRAVQDSIAHIRLGSVLRIQRSLLYLSSLHLNSLYPLELLICTSLLLILVSELTANSPLTIPILM